MRNQSPPPGNIAATDVFHALVAHGLGPRELDGSIGMRFNWELLFNVGICRRCDR